MTNRTLIALATVAALAAPTHAQQSPPNYRAEVFNTAATQNVDILGTALSVYAASGQSRVTCFRVTVSLVTTDSVLNVTATKNATTITKKLNGGTALTAGVDYTLYFDAVSGTTYNLQVATSTTIGTMIVVEIPNALASRGGGGAGGALALVTTTGDALTGAGTSGSPLAAASDVENFVDAAAFTAGGQLTFPGPLLFTSDNATDIGASGATRPRTLYAGTSVIVPLVNLGTATDREGTGSPEGVVTAVVGSTFRRTNGSTSTALYVKESGAGNTGWVNYASNVVAYVTCSDPTQIDVTSPEQTLTLSGNTTFGAAAAGLDGVPRTVEIEVTCDGSTRTLTFDADWSWYGTKPATMTASTRATLTLKSETNNAAGTGVTAVWTVKGTGA